MTATMPARRWGDKETAPAEPPTILVSSRDNAPVPAVAGAVRLATLAEANGWTVRQTYALAAVPDRWYLNGRLAKAAHQLASVAVRLTRGKVRGWAMWHRIDEASWLFVEAILGRERLGWQRSKTSDRRTILEAILADSPEGKAA